jgi:hypothetical protein
MSLLSIQLPPGIKRSGTVYQSKGRWYDSNLVRPRQDATMPVAGWQLRSDAAAFSGACRCVLTWRDNSGNNWIGVGSSSHLYVQDEAGTNHDITPAGYVVGRDDATQNVGYGGAPYGIGLYGTPSPGTDAFLPATVWTLQTWGEDQAACADSDGKIYLWSLVTATPAAVVANAPVKNVGIVVTQEGFLFALGATGDGRRVAWCDQQNITLWAADATNQAGDYDLPTSGTLQCGCQVPGGALLLTDIDAWLAGYVGAPLVYGFNRVGSGCGPISRGAMAANGAVAVWMGRGGFWLFDGQSVQPLDCEAFGAAFGNINTNQQSKVTAVHLADEGEVWWFYPSASSNENDSYICWCYRESERLGRNVWMIGTLARTAGDGRGVFTTPIMVGPDGLVREHETGINYDGLQPYIESGPFEIGLGDFMAEVQMVIPDQFADGDYSATFFNRYWPEGPESVVGPVTLVSPTDVLFQATETRVRYTALTTSATSTIGNVRLSVIQGDPFDSALGVS